MNVLFRALAITVFLFAACKAKKEKDPSEKFFPVIAYIKSEIADVDTSLYSIRKIVILDSLREDTIYLRREAFRDAAVDFLSLPDISTSKYDDRYVESKQFDESLNRATLVYTPVKPENEEIQRQEVLIAPSGDQVKTIIVHSVTNNKDTTIEKRMFWSIHEQFQVTTIKQYKDDPEIISTYKVVWNEQENE